MSRYQTAAASLIAALTLAGAAAAHPQERVPRTIKPGAAAQFSHVVKQAAKAGGRGVLEVTLDERYAEGWISVSVTASPGLVLTPVNQDKTFEMTGAGPHVFDIYFRAEAPGAHYLNFIAQTDEASGLSAPRSYSAAIPVKGDGGAPAASKSAAPAFGVSETGETLIMMEAEETIEQE